MILQGDCLEVMPTLEAESVDAVVTDPPYGLEFRSGRLRRDRAASSRFGGGDEDDLTPGKKSTKPRLTTHPTVKPLELMRHLVRLVTPPGGLLIDPFLGSGTTAIAAEMEGFRWIGIEREPEYVAQAEARLHGTQKGLGLPA